MADYIYINPEYEALLRRHGLVDLVRLLQWSTGDLVGEHGPRTTWRVTLDDPRGRSGVFYIRQESWIPWGEVLEDLGQFRRPASRALKTLRATELFSAAGIAVAPLCGLIERRFLDRPTRAAAVQAHAPGQDLYALLRSFGRPGHRTDNPPARQRLLRELGELLARIGRARVHWPDLVAKHLLVTESGIHDPHWRFTLIDIERARPGLTAAQRNRQFDRFLVSLRALLTPTDLLRLARGFLGRTACPPRSVRRTLWRKFFPRGRAWLDRARDEMAALRHFPEDQPLPEEEIYERIGSTVINQRFKEELKALGLLEKDALFTFEQGSELHKPGLGGRTRLRFEAVANGHRTWFYLKRTRRPKWADQWSRISSGTLRHSGAWHERYLIKQLGRHRIPAPVVVAYAEKMIAGYERTGALVTRAIVGQSLEKFVPKHFTRSPDTAELLRRRRWMRQLASLIRRFHRAGFCHRDLYLSHVFISLGCQRDPVFSLIDLGRAFRMTWRRRRWIVKDLAALNFSAPEKIISNTDRVRFLKAYLKTGRWGREERRMARQILAKTRQIARHHRRNPKATRERSISP